MKEAVSMVQAATHGTCPYHWTMIPATKGMTSRTNGNARQAGAGVNVCIRVNHDAVACERTAVGRKQRYGAAAPTYPHFQQEGIGRSVMTKEVKEGIVRYGQKKFPQVFVENKGLEEICRRVSTGILDS